MLRRLFAAAGFEIFVSVISRTRAVCRRFSNESISCSDNAFPNNELRLFFSAANVSGLLLARFCRFAIAFVARVSVVVAGLLVVVVGLLVVAAGLLAVVAGLLAVVAGLLVIATGLLAVVADILVVVAGLLVVAERAAPVVLSETGFAAGSCCGSDCGHLNWPR